MTDQTVLPELVRRESRSFMQYVRESFPWARGRDTALLDTLLRLGAAEGEHIASLGRLLQKRHIPMPGLGAYPSAFTNFNYVAATSLVRKLLAAQRQSLNDLERDLFRITDDEARIALESYRDLKRQHIGELESLITA